MTVEVGGMREWNGTRRSGIPCITYYDKMRILAAKLCRLSDWLGFVLLSSKLRNAGT